MSDDEGLDVELSTDAGGYYCEHVLYLAKLTLQRKRAGGRAMFLHVVKDDCATNNIPAKPSRFDSIDEIVERVLRRFIEEGARMILLTGFGPFRDVIQNPSGDYLSSERYQKTKTDLLKMAPVDLIEKVLPVDDRAIDGKGRSIQHWIETHQPDIVLSMGVAKDVFCAETVATDRNLSHEEGPISHVESLASRHRFAKDETLFRAWFKAPES